MSEAMRDETSSEATPDSTDSAVSAPDAVDGAAATGSADAATDAGPRRTVGAALGEIAWLLTQSPTHRYGLFLADLEWLVMPPLTLGQYRLFYAEGKPIGAALWAFVDDTVGQRLAGGGRLAANEWRSGDRLWLVELIAPFGNQQTMIDNLRQTALADRRFRFLRTQASGRRETVTVNGVNAE